MADKIEVNYEQLQSIIQQFEREGQALEALARQTKTKADALYSSSWSGQGANAFRAEMEGLVLPGMGRLAAALEESGRTLRQVVLTFQSAEEESAGFFKSNGGLSFENGVGARLPRETAPEVEGAGKITFGNDGRKFGLGLNVPIAKGKILEIDYEKSESGWGGLTHGWKNQLSLGKWDAGIGLGVDDGKGYAGGYAHGVLLEEKISDSIDLGGVGFGRGITVKGLEGEALVGYHHGNLGVKAGFNLISVEGKAGVNIGDYNVGLVGEAGLKWEWGFVIGKRTEVEMGPFSLGVDLGERLGSQKVRPSIQEAENLL